MLTGKVMAWGIQHGYREYDFLTGGRHYKARWSSGERKVVSIRAFAKGPYVGCYRRGASLVTWLRSRLPEPVVAFARAVRDRYSGAGG